MDYDRTDMVSLAVTVVAVVTFLLYLLVPKELEPCHPVSPWLAGLYVDPKYRLHNVGRMLVRAIESESRLRGNDRLYLYTDGAIGYYQRQGWIAEDEFDWKGIPTTLMVRHLRP